MLKIFKRIIQVNLVLFFVLISLNTYITDSNYSDWSFFAYDDESIELSTYTSVTNTNNSITYGKSQTFYIAPNMTVSAPTNITSGSVVLSNVPTDTTISYTAVSGITVSYNSSKGVYTLTGNTTADNYQTLFRSFRMTSGTTLTSNASVSFTVNTGSGNATYFADTGHYYEYITYNSYWVNAKSNASTKYFNERQGYLVTITSASENEFVAQKLSADGWIGASDETSEGVWKWVTGPEAGTQFWSGASTGYSVSGRYSNWSSGEPNNWNGNEDYAQFYYRTKYWNDLGSSNTQSGYIIEYGGLSTDTINGDYEETVNINIENQYTAQYLSYDNSVLATGSYIEGTDLSSYQVPTPVDREGYTFNSWDGTLPSTMPAYHITIRPIYDLIYYDITYELNGGSVASGTPSTYSIESSFTFGIPSKEGYTFGGWYLEETFTNEITNIALGSSSIYGSINLYAKWIINTYAINYNLNGGTNHLDNPSSYQITSNDINLLEPIKTGYTFAGWYTTSTFDLGTDIYSINSGSTSNVDLYAKFTINSYTITFDTNGGSTINVITQNYNTQVALPNDPTKEGYTFVGWDQAVPTNIPAENITITAQWIINSYTITFDTNGGSTIDAITQNYNTQVVLPNDPTKEGYTFVGWDQAVPTNMPAENLVLSANWLILGYTIVFDTDGGTEISTISLDYNSLVTLPNDPTKEGYTFVGWDQAVPTNMPAEDLTITALWSINSYTITFDTNGGSSIDAITQNYNTQVALPNDPTKEGYTFVGWDQAVPTNMPAEDLTITASYIINNYDVIFQDYDGTVIESISFEYLSSLQGILFPGEPLREGYTFRNWDTTLPEAIGSSDITLTAVYEINQYTLEFHDYDQSVIQSTLYDFNTDLTQIELPQDPSRNGYTFSGWDLTVPSQMVAENVVITATYSINAYTITFDCDGGTALSQLNLSFNTEITMPENPTKEGYTFSGWDQTLPLLMPAENLILVALWSVNSYAITFDTDGGSSIDTINFDYLSEITMPEDPTKEGYTFIGWEQDILELMPANDLAFKALWSTNQYTITFDTNGGNQINVLTFDYNDEIGNLDVPTKEGYTFIGWDQIIPTNMPANDLLLVATYEINSYLVTWYDMGGNILLEENVVFQEIITQPTYEVRGYDFDGWYLDTNYQTLIDDTMQTTNLEVYPKLIAHSYSFEVVVNEISYQIDVTSGQVFNDDEPISINGFMFIGWFTSPNGEGIKLDGTTILVSDDFKAYPYYVSQSSNQRVLYTFDEEILTLEIIQEKDLSNTVLVFMGILSLSLFTLHRYVSKKDVM